MNYISGSVAPFDTKTNNDAKNPSFMVLNVDPETMLPVDIDSYVLDLAQANKDNTPKW